MQLRKVVRNVRRPLWEWIGSTVENSQLQRVADNVCTIFIEARVCSFRTWRRCYILILSVQPRP